MFVWQDKASPKKTKQKPPQKIKQALTCVSQGSEFELCSIGDMPGKYSEVTVLLTSSPDLETKILLCAE